MKLELRRTYYAGGTNGTLLADNRVLCSTIERAWADNLRLVSCIPEGKYAVMKRYTKHLGPHLLVMDVPGRDTILIHPANDAMRELKGCIAPVMKLQGPGRGLYSREALNIVLQHVQVSLSEGQAVYLVVTKEPVSTPAQMEGTGNSAAAITGSTAVLNGNGNTDNHFAGCVSGKTMLRPGDDGNTRNSLAAENRQCELVPETTKKAGPPALLRQMIFSPEIKNYAINY